MAVNGVVVVKPSVHGAPRMTIDNGLVDTVQHVFEVRDLEFACGFTVVTACETNVHRGPCPQEALLGGAVLGGVMGFGCAHAVT